jgi:hypothetical protein
MSGRVRDELAARGFDAWSADLLPSESPDFQSLSNGDAHHYQGDVRDLFDGRHPVNARRLAENDARSRAGLRRLPLWDLIIAHPPCDHLALVGANRWAQKRADGRQDAAAEFFMEMVNAPSPLVAVENPRGDMKRRYRAPDQEVQPWMFGDAFEKTTCLWLRGLPPLQATHSKLDFPELQRMVTGGGSWKTDKGNMRKAMSAYEDSEGRARRSIVRSRTMPGLAKAMAQQWSVVAKEYAEQHG